MEQNNQAIGQNEQSNNVANQQQGGVEQYGFRQDSPNGNEDENDGFLDFQNMIPTV